MRTVIRHGGIAVIAVLSLAGCGPDTATAPTATVTVSVSAPVSPSPDTTASGQAPLTQIDTDEPTTPAGGRTCTPGAGPLAPAERDKSRIPGLGPDNFWQITDSGGEWCNALSWVTLWSGVVMGPVRPHQLLIYQDGVFLGTGIRCNIKWGQEIVSTTTDSVTVRYLYPDPTNPAQMHTQNPLGTAVTTYRWNGSRIVMEQALPAVALENNC